MPTGPVSPADPGRDDPTQRPGEPGLPDDPNPGEPGEVSETWRELPPSREDWLSEDEWVEWLSRIEPEEWSAPDEEDVDGEAVPGAPKRSTRAAGGRTGTAGGSSRPGKGSARAVKGSRRGPGQPGSARRVPGDSPGPGGAFVTGQPLDTAPGGAALFGFAEYAAGDGDRFGGTTDDELTGLICALDRVEASASALKHAAVGEIIRRRPGKDSEPVLAGAGAWEEFLTAELSYALAETRWGADLMMDLSWTLDVKLPGTRALFRSGVLRQSKVEIIARAVAALDPDEARQAEALVLDRAGRLTPGGLRDAIRRAVLQVAPEKAVKQRKDAQRQARVERWPEHSGNAGLAGRELPPADVLAADQRVTWWAKKLGAAGLEGDMDQLRARAFLDIMLGRDSRPRLPAGMPGGGQGGSGPAAPEGTGLPPVAGVIPAGFAGRINLTAPLSTLLGLAERPGELAGFGPVDPELTRDLAGAAAANPKTTWCVTVTDQHGHAIGHGCARPAPAGNPGSAGNPAPASGSASAGDPGPARARDGPGFSFTPAGRPGPSGGYGIWRLHTGIPGQRDLLLTIDPIALQDCDHRFEARGHDPGVKLRHLTQIRHATCTGPTCRRPSVACDFEHNIPYETGDRTCMCNGGPKCRFEHRLKQDPRWNVEQVTPGTFRWTVPSGRQYTTEPTRYPI